MKNKIKQIVKKTAITFAILYTLNFAVNESLYIHNINALNRIKSRYEKVGEKIKKIGTPNKDFPYRFSKSEMYKMGHIFFDEKKDSDVTPWGREYDSLEADSIELWNKMNRLERKIKRFKRRRFTIL